MYVFQYISTYVRNKYLIFMSIYFWFLILLIIFYFFTNYSWLCLIGFIISTLIVLYKTNKSIESEYGFLKINGHIFNYDSCDKCGLSKYTTLKNDELHACITNEEALIKNILE